MALTLNTSTNFPPGGNPPYRINREWCLGDSLGYINANTETFTNKCNELEELTDIQNNKSPFKKINNILKTAPIFIPVGWPTNINDGGGDNSNIQIENRVLNSDTAFYSGDIKTWYSPSFFVQIPNLGISNYPPVTNTQNPIVDPRTVAVLVSVYFNTNSKGNNGTTFLVKKASRPGDIYLPGNSTYPNSAEIDRYVKKIQMDPTGGDDTAYEAESDVTMVIYLDTAGNLVDTFSWRISSGKTKNPWATGTEYTVKINLLGYYVQYPSYVNYPVT